MNDPDSNDDELTLELPDAIAQRSDMSQRQLSAKLGIAPGLTPGFTPGLTNPCLERCARRGLVKVKEVPTDRYPYYAAPRGFAKKSRLRARFLSTLLNFHRQAAESCGALFTIGHRNQWVDVVLCEASNPVDLLRMYRKVLECVPERKRIPGLETAIKSR